MLSSRRVSLVVALTFFVLAFIAVARPARAVWNPFAKKTYTLTVVNGLGSGTYTAGTKVAVAAVIPVSTDGSPAMTFAAWLSAGPSAWGSRPTDFVNANAASTVFTMPKHNETVQATFSTVTP